MLEFSLCGRRKNGRGRGEGEKCDPLPFPLPPYPLTLWTSIRHGLQEMRYQGYWV